MVKKRISALALALVLCLGLLVVPAGAASPEGDFNTSSVAGGVSITNYTGSGGVVEVPASIGGQPVISIGNNAFERCTGLTGITLPASVTSIGNNAFERCTGLTGITLPAGVTSIGNNAFKGCTSLTSVILPDSVTSIGNNAFEGCTDLTGITIPAGVTSINNDAFKGCTGLTGITIPAGVTSIRNAAFVGCTSLTSVTIQGSPSIGNDAFKGCTDLTGITIPAGVASIGSGAFSGCTGLTSVTIQGSPSIGNNAFEGCTSLTGITLPDSVTSIGDNVFSGCIGLTSVTIPAGVTSIGMNAFSGCTGLTSLTILGGASSVQTGAFSGCNSLETLTIGSGDYTALLGNNDIQAYKTLQFLGKTPPTIGNNTITKNPGDLVIRIPAGTKAAYETALQEATNNDLTEYTIKESYYAHLFPNGGTGHPNLVAQESDNFTMPQCAFTPPKGKVFAGWSLSPSGDSLLNPGDVQKLTTDDPPVTFYAIWQEPQQLPPAPPVQPPVQPTPPPTPVVDDDDEEPTYAPSYEIIGKGKAVTNPRTPAAGQNVTLTLTPEEGWEVSTLRLSTRTGEVDATRNADGTYSYTQPEGRVTIRVVFREVWKNPFHDVPEDAWYMDALRLVLDQGLMSGMADGTFNPDGTASRQQVWMILARLSGYQPADMAAAKAWATANGISDGTNPGGAVTRQQLWMLLARVAGERPADMASAKAWAVANGISDGSNPGGAITRAQLAVMLQRFLER